MISGLVSGQVILPRVIPTLTHYSDNFWHSFWHITWKYIWHIYIYIFWHSIWHSFWHILWHSFWHSIWRLFWLTFRHIFWQSFWHSLWHAFSCLQSLRFDRIRVHACGSRRAQLHPELTISRNRFGFRLISGAREGSGARLPPELAKGFGRVRCPVASGPELDIELRQRRRVRWSEGVRHSIVVKI